MPKPLTTIRNIGPAMEQALHSAGVSSAEALIEMGSETAYRKLVESGHRPHFIAFYALVMGLQGRPWNDCAGAEKANLRKQFDQIVKEAAPVDNALSRALDEVGVRL